MSVAQPAMSSTASISRDQADAAIADLSAVKDEWANLSADKKADLLDAVHRDLAPLAERWATACCEAKGLDPNEQSAGEEWLAFATLLRDINLVRRSLRDIAKTGRPRIPGPIQSCGDEQLSVRVLPQDLYDRLFFMGLSVEIWTQPGIDRERLLHDQAAIYRDSDRRGIVTLVLGAGNFSLLGPCDVLYKMFCEGHVVLFKNHPLTAYLGPLIEKGFRALIERDYLRVAYGGADESAYIIGHEQVDELHITGSDRTHDAIVFGAGEDGVARKAADQPIMEKRFTCELGNISPVIVVPGPWSKRDIDYQGEHLASMLTINAGFNCLTTRLIVQHDGWSQRQSLLAAMRSVLSATPTRPAYYPGSQSIHEQFLNAHPEAELIGESDDERLPWTVVAGVDSSNHDDICFTTEPFCSLLSETSIAAENAADYVDRAVEFVNTHIWGSLTTTLLVHPKSMRDPAVAAAVERAISNLRYGTVGVNAWGILNYMTLAGTWGAFPGHPRTDIQSGSGTVHNSQMIPHVQKTVLRAPFRQFLKPVFFPSHRSAMKMARQLTRHETKRSWLNLPGISWSALRS